MKAAKLLTYGVLGIITGLLLENKTLKLRRRLELKTAELKGRMQEKCAKAQARK